MCQNCKNGWLVEGRAEKGSLFSARSSRLARLALYRSNLYPTFQTVNTCLGLAASLSIFRLSSAT